MIGMSGIELPLKAVRTNIASAIHLIVQVSWCECQTAQTSKSKKVVEAEGVAHIKATFNNTLITITDINGDVVCRASAGTVGFKGTRKSTPFAAQRAVEQAASVARKMGMVEVEVKVRGPGSGRTAPPSSSTPRGRPPP